MEEVTHTISESGLADIGSVLHENHGSISSGNRLQKGFPDGFQKG